MSNTPNVHNSTRPRNAALPRWDDGATVKVVRRPDGTAFLVAIRCPLPWVLRRPYLVPEDVD